MEQTSGAENSKNRGPKMEKCKACKNANLGYQKVYQVEPEK